MSATIKEIIRKQAEWIKSEYTKEVEMREYASKLIKLLQDWCFDGNKYWYPFDYKEGCRADGPKLTNAMLLKRLEKEIRLP